MAFTYKHGDQPLTGYTIQRGVGRGGFGEVYYAISDGGKEVALKYLREQPDIELRGVASCLNLKSPHLVSIFDVKSNDEGDEFVIMEYVKGPSLRELLLAEPGGLGVQKAAFFAREIGKGLSYLHDRGIVHRDLKPGNIFYEEGYVKIGDYGLSKFITVSRHSGQTASVGTVHYMAPEVGSGNYHRGIDIYSLGVMLYEMIVGRVPFEGATMGEVLMKHLMDSPAVDEMPKPFGKVIRRALEKDPKDRYQRVEEMISDLLEEEDLEKSLAGFEPASLTAAAEKVKLDMGSGLPRAIPVGRQGQAKGRQEHGQARPPKPPMGRRPKTKEEWKKFGEEMGQWGEEVGGYMAEWGHTAGGRAARRAMHKAEKVARRMHKKAGKPLKKVQAVADQMGGTHLSPALKQERLLRMGTAAAVTIGLSLGIALLSESAEMFVGGIYLIPTLTVGALLVDRLCQSISYGRDWLFRSLVTAGVISPVLLLFSGLGEGLFNEGDFCLALSVALLATMVVANWSKRIEAGKAEQVSFGDAFSVGLFAALAGLCTGYPDIIVVAAGIAAAVSLVLQTVVGALGKGSEAGSGGDRVLVTPPPLGATPGDASWPAGAEVVPQRIDSPFQQSGGMETPSARVRRVRRSNFARVFWAFIAASMLSAGAITFAFMGIQNLQGTDEAMAIMIGTGLCTGMLFPLTRMSRYRQRGFWMNWVRPVMVSAGLVAAAVGGVAIGFADELRLTGDEEMLIPIAATIAGGVFALFFFLAGWRPIEALQDVFGQGAARGEEG
jgi:hypothetical protein